MRSWPSVYGHLGLFLWALAATILLPGWLPAWVLGALLVAHLLLRAVGPMPAPRQLWRWAFLLAFLMGTPVLVSGSGERLSALILGAQMVLRAATVTIAAHLFARSVSVAELTGLFERLGARGLGFAVGVAFNLLPTVLEAARNTYQAMRLRGAFRRLGLRDARLFLVALVVNTLRHGEEVVEAAESRAFDPAQPLPSPAPRPAAADAVLVGLALMTTAAALLW
ncbi:MAG: energy-coupling factor transporter transmembrane component T [Anaerolineae bacterium]